MKTTPRFDRAIEKLYTAFHNGTLHPECACHCAVGNICDKQDNWKHLSDDHGSLRLNYVGKVNEAFGRRLNGYLPSELLRIEQAFLIGCGYSLPLRHNHKKPANPRDQWVQFKGLCEAVKCLCQLDGIPDVMNYSELFDFSFPEHEKSCTAELS